MSLVRDIIDSIFFPHRDVHAIPVLDGALTPNQRLEEADVLASLPEPDSLLGCPDGSVLVSSGHAIMRVSTDGSGAREVFAETPGVAGALARGAGGEIYVAVAGSGVLAYSPQGGMIACLSTTADGDRLGCVTAIAVDGQGNVYLTDGSRRNDAEGWLVDLMQKSRPSGRLVRCAADLSDPKVLCEGLSWPAGVAIAEGGRKLLVSESWSHRLLSISAADGSLEVLVKNFTGYPARIAPAATGGYWVTFFALRTQLTEFLLREDEFRARMMQSVPPKLWIGPTLGGHFDYREPTQVGQIKKLGIQKPWAPPRSYGLVARLSADGTAFESLHSRVAGTLHGITDAREIDGRLIFVAKGQGKLAAADLPGGRA